MSVLAWRTSTAKSTNESMTNIGEIFLTEDCQKDLAPYTLRRVTRTLVVEGQR